MHPLQFGTIDAILIPVLPFIALVLVLFNVATRYLAHRQYVEQADDYGPEGIERNTVHSLTTILLVLVTFYYILVDLHTGVVLATFALTMFLADFFEFESRLVEARTDRQLEPPKAAIGASAFLLAYAGYVVLVELFGAFWSPVI